MAILVWLGTEGIFYWRFSRGVNEEAFTVPDRDIAFERRVYRWAVAICAIGYAVAVAMVLLL